MNRKAFYDVVRAELEKDGSLSQDQVDGFEKILDEGLKRKVMLTQMANILAQMWLETAYTCQPVREYGSESYLKSKKYYPWVGEGLIQVTWEENHRKFGATAPGQLLTWPIALRALFDGMLFGMFTGKRLSDYINSQQTDYKGARKVVNGTDRDEDIKKYSESFERALKAMKYTTTAIAPVPPAPPKPVTPPVPTAPPEPKGLFKLFLEFLKKLFGG